MSHTRSLKNNLIHCRCLILQNFCKEFLPLRGREVLWITHCVRPYMLSLCQCWKAGWLWLECHYSGINVWQRKAELSHLNAAQQARSSAEHSWQLACGNGTWWGGREYEIFHSLLLLCKEQGMSVASCWLVLFFSAPHPVVPSSGADCTLLCREGVLIFCVEKGGVCRTTHLKTLDWVNFTMFLRK